MTVKIGINGFGRMGRLGLRAGWGLKGLHFSQNIMLALIKNGMSRENAYAIVQKNAMKTWKSIGSIKEKSFYLNLSSDKNIISKINKKELKKIFDNKTYLKNISFIFKNLFKN